MDWETRMTSGLGGSGGGAFLEVKDNFMYPALYPNLGYATIRLAGMQKQTGYSAVGSALRSGRRGRQFESGYPDQGSGKGWLP